VSTEIQQSDAQGKLAEYIKQLFKAASRARYAEEREWATAGYFDQLKQWLEEDPNARGKLRPMSRKKDDKWPMPVTNLFSKTIATNANALGADVPRMRALSGNYDAVNRRAAEAAENVIDAANRESGMDILNPRLARMVPLFGIAGVYDKIAFDHSTVEVPQLPQAAPQLSAAPSTDSQQPSQPLESQDASPEVSASGVQTVPTARLESLLLTPFEFYLPREAQDANLSAWKLIRVRLPIGKVKEDYPDYAEEITEDDDDANLASYYLNTLRSLSYQTAKSNESEGKFCTLMHFWCDWTELPKEVQEKISAEWQNEPSEIYEEQGFSKLQAAIEYGLFAVVWKDCIIQWAENPWDGNCPVTFFTWQKDPVSVYPKGLSVELIPPTKSLNRVDSLILRAVMSTGTGKWLVPNTQTQTQLSGDPVEAIYWDPIGEGKIKPEFITPTPFGPQLLALRKQIVEDINQLGFNNSVAEGEMPGSGTAFRALAYLGSKAEETRKTQRYLWEQAHEERAKKLVPMARKVWTEPRKAQVRGFNNAYGMVELDMADLDGEYQIQVIQDSSKPKTQTEKLQVLQLAQQGGYINPQDPQTRDWVLDTLGLNDLDPSDHYQFAKAERDLDKLKRGIQPMESPFEKWDIPLKVCAEYTLTEEFEEMPDNIRNGILMYTQYLSEKLQVANGAQLGVPAPPPGMLPAGPPAPGGASPDAPKGGVGGQTPSHVLSQVPGAQVSTGQTEGAAIREAAQIVPNSPSPTA
jgi:hypothetical protein